MLQSQYVYIMRYVVYYPVSRPIVPAQRGALGISIRDRNIIDTPPHR